MKKYSISNGPLHLTIKKILLDEIGLGNLANNGKIPSEQALAQQFNVSRMTIRNALQSLENDGFVTRRHGIGTFLNVEGLQLKVRINEAMGFFHLIRQSGHQPSIYETKLKSIVLADHLCKILGLAPKQEAILLERLFLGDGKPVIAVAEYIPKIALVREPTIEEVPESIFHFIEMFSGQSIDYSITEIASIRVNSKLKKKMLLDSEETLLKLEELHYTNKNKPIAFSFVYVRDKIIRFQVLRRRQSF